MTMLRAQLHADLLAFRRAPSAVFFTVGLPIIFLVLFESIFGSQKVPGANGQQIDLSTLQVPGFMVMGVVSASFVSLCITMVNRREAGVFKRVRGTPAPAWVLIAGQVVATLIVAILMVVLMVLLGQFAYDVALDWSHLWWLILGVLVGAVAFSALGMALASVVPSLDAAAPIANLIVLPLYFISGVFVPVNELPTWLANIASYLPIRPFVEVLSYPYDPGTSLPWSALLILIAWGVVGLALAARFFRWTPRHT